MRGMAAISPSLDTSRENLECYYKTHTRRSSERQKIRYRKLSSASPPSPSSSLELIMVGGRVAHPVLKGPSVVKELIIGSVLGLAAGGLWKMHHWNEQRKTRAFYDLLEKGEISVVVQE
ncbi:putative cytochrome c oxidase subunit 5c [Helianthus annuus]|nr:putative cytochrome c oxidase subunit 5c [Helianthus annuus]